MVEAYPPGGARSPEDQRIPPGHYGSMINLSLRWEAYRYGRRNQSDLEDAYRVDDFHATVAREVEIHDGDVLVDAGCGNGETLKEVHSLNRDTDCLLVGIDLEDSPSLRRYREAVPASPARIELLRGDGGNMPLPDDSVDTVLSLFSLYHFNDIEGGVNEFRRILKPGTDSTLVVATSGAANKVKHRLFEQNIADYLSGKFTHTRPPLVMADHFNGEFAYRLLNRFFPIVEHSAYHDEMVFEEDQLEVYLGSLLTMMEMFDPVPHGSQWTDAVTNAVMPKIEEELQLDRPDGRHYFTDTIERHYFICKGVPSADKPIPRRGSFLRRFKDKK